MDFEVISGPKEGWIYLPFDAYGSLSSRPIFRLRAHHFNDGKQGRLKNQA